MGLFGFGKKKKTLEDLSKEFGVKLGAPNPSEDYAAFQVKGVKSSANDATEQLFKNAKSQSVLYLFDISAPTEKRSAMATNYIVTAVGYIKK